MRFRCVEADGTWTPVDPSIDHLVNCGFTGRDEEEVQDHIDELIAEGVSPPEEVPTLYPKPVHLLSRDSTFQVLSPNTSGEVEFVLLPDADDAYVGVGSDHTDRELEADSVPLSKAVCPNVVSEAVWRLSDVADHWDDIVIRSWNGEPRDPDEYQHGTLERLLPPDELRELVADVSTHPVENTAIFSGSIGTVSGELTYGRQFRAELYDPHLDRSLRIAYQVDPIAGL